MSDLLIVTWDKQRVAALQTSRNETARIAAVWSAAWPENLGPGHSPKSTGEWLRSQWAAAGLMEKSVWVVVPRDEVVLRHLELPQAPDEELADMVRFQAASRSTVPLEQTCLDFIPLAPFPGREGRDVLAATLPKSNLENLRQIITAADRELAGVSFSSHALGEWGEQTDRRHSTSLRLQETESTLVVAWEEARVDLSIVCGRELTFARSARIAVTEGVDPTSSVLAEVSRTLVAGQRLRPGLKVDHGWLIGGDAVLARALSTRLECAFEPIDPVADHPQATQLKPLQGHPITAAMLLGVRSPSVTPGINFLKPRQPPPKRDPRKRQIAVAAAAALLLAFLGVGGGILRLQSLDRQIANKYSEKVDLETIVKGGQPIQAAASVVSDWTIRDVNQLQELVELEQIFPGDIQRPYLSSYEFTRGDGDVLGTIDGSGSARSRQDIDQLQSDLVVERGYRLFTNEVTTSRDPQYQYRFTLDMNIPRKKPVPANSATEPAPKS